MQALFELLPVFLFFIAFKMYNVYVATIVGIVSTFIQVVAYRIMTRKWDRKQLITLAVFIILGSLTFYFHNAMFIKWKPTVVFWIFAIVLLVSQFTQKPISQRLLESMLEDKATVPSFAWRRLNLYWMFFFILLGCVNLYIAYNFDDNTWVNFKFYGVTLALFLFSVFQVIYLMRYMSEKSEKKNSTP